MSDRDKVIRYMEGDMAPTEKREFEAELHSSDNLKREIKLYKKLMRSIDETKKIPADQNYTATIIPKFRAGQVPGRRKFYPAYAVITAAAALMLLFINLPQEPVKDENNNTAALELADSAIIDLAEIEGNIDSAAVTNNEEYTAAIDEMLGNELNITEEELDSIYYSAYSGNSQSLTEITDEESKIVYDEIINKSFF